MSQNDLFGASNSGEPVRPDTQMSDEQFRVNVDRVRAGIQGKEWMQVGADTLAAILSRMDSQDQLIMRMASDRRKALPANPELVDSIPAGAKKVLGVITALPDEMFHHAEVAKALDAFFTADLTIADDVGYEVASEFLKLAARTDTVLEEDRKVRTRPLDDEKKRITELYRPARTLLAKLIANDPREVKGRIVAAMIDYTKRKQQKEREAAAAATAALRKDVETAAIADASRAEAAGDPKRAEQIIQQAATRPVQQITPGRAAPKVTGVRMVAETWDWAVEDESLIPDRYWLLDRATIAAEVKKHGDKANIAGVVVFPGDPEIGSMSRR